MKETDLRYVKTERAIRDAFFELLEESDFDKVSVTDITQRAQINRNTFYLHYSDKFNLVNSILIDFVQELSQQALKVIDQAENRLHAQKGVLASLQRFKGSVKEVQAGYECGLCIEKFNDIKEGDIVEAFTMEQIEV